MAVWSVRCPLDSTDLEDMAVYSHLLYTGTQLDTPYSLLDQSHRYSYQLDIWCRWMSLVDSSDPQDRLHPSHCLQITKHKHRNPNILYRISFQVSLVTLPFKHCTRSKSIIFACVLPFMNLPSNLPQRQHGLREDTMLSAWRMSYLFYPAFYH